MLAGQSRYLYTPFQEALAIFKRASATCSAGELPHRTCESVVFGFLRIRASMSAARDTCCATVHDKICCRPVPQA